MCWGAIKNSMVITSNLDRFLDAQASVYESVLAELKDGRKRTHWMWFVFPQIDGLGSSKTAQHFAIQDSAYRSDNRRYVHSAEVASTRSGRISRGYGTR